MGQSQSLTNQYRKQHIRAQKTFGFIFFQKDFDNVVRTKDEAVEKKYKYEREKHFVDLKKAKYKALKFKEWNVLKENLSKEYDMENKERRKREINDFIQPVQLLANLDNVIDDAKKMYEFLQNIVCKNLTEITIMCDKKQLTEVICPSRQEKTYFELIVKQKELWKKHKIATITSRYQSFGLFLDWHEYQEHEKQLEYELRHEKNRFLEEQEYLHCIGQEELPKFLITNFTKNPSALALEIKKCLYSHMIPEVTRSYLKLQANFLYQFLSQSTRKKLFKLQKPNHLEPSHKNYETYIQMIQKYALLNKKEEILSIQTFAGHGMIVNGQQKMLTNNYCASNQFYELIDVEQIMRVYSKRMVNVFFLVVFACC